MTTITRDVQDARDKALAVKALLDDAWLESEDIDALDVQCMADTLGKAFGHDGLAPVFFDALVEDAWIGTDVITNEDIDRIAEVVVSALNAPHPEHPRNDGWERR